MVQSANSRKRTRGSALLGPWIGSLLGASLAAAITFVVATHYQPGELPAIPIKQLPSSEQAASEGALSESAKPEVARSVQRARFYDQQVEPQIEAADKLNREAADRCVQGINDVIAQYRRGIDPFVDDLTSLSTRFGIVKRMPGDWWREDNRIETFVQEKFELHLFSEQKLMDDITGVLEQFKNEIDANQKRMLVSVKTALGTADLPEVQADEYQPFFEAVAKQLQQYSAQQGTASVQNAVGVFVISEAGVFAGRTIVVGLLARFGSAAVVSSAAGASATAGTAAAGTGTGAFGGPVGVVVGFGVGLAVGLVIDWWMTERFEARMSEQMNDYLDTLNNIILYGGKQDQNSPGNAGPIELEKAGLIDALPVVCDRLREAYRERFYEQIVTGVPSS